MADLKSRRTQSTTASIMTPPATDDHEPTIVDGPWNGLSYAVPWPGSLFIIVEKSTGRTIAFRNGKISLESMSDLHSNIDGPSSDKAKLWFCAEKDGHFGFQNQVSGKYLGHDGNYNIVAKVNHLRGYEFVVVRKHPLGGYQLLTTHGSALRVVSVDEEGGGLVAREHGPALWEFYKV
jgi:hypothetical protein